ncbi:ATP-binding cassette domain-containing protein [Bacillus salacetis]|uniref:ATP-binding cassette domain-containing protein n=1 Tax=Bacillus salacetis TaxID=2315464 RepID=A0A3A1QS90_9BACI|nr:ATP-binding cassette domain-containing protein [Bacillus salacetis]RIW30153.1 ATP-binding cassette domain-containing protein [Bacillus salacetis]
MFRLNDVSYHGILTSINLEFGDGVVSCMTGPSGAGKSTILKFLNKMLVPTSGEVFYNDRNLQSMDSVELRRKVVMLQQNPVMFEGSVEDNLQIGLRFARVQPASPAELEDALRMVMLEKRLEEPADKLSGGEKQRLALARVYLMKPRVYLLDEPTSALDPETEGEVMGEFLKAVKEQSGTVIMVTHSKTVSDRFGESHFYIEPKSRRVQS